ncbi:MAG: DUF4271 domain-containing protein [Prevotellaceae bacterium]|nr:DUF4271 domain-containing protein [Prevotellaceae bacterium]
MTAVSIICTAAAGMEGIPMPYTPRMDDGITAILLGCFFLSAYILSRSRKFLQQLAKDFLLHRERPSIFTTSTATDLRYLLLLLLQTCVLGGIYFFDCSVDKHPALLGQCTPFLLLAIYTGGCLLYLFAKWLLYTFLGWIFFDKNIVSLWLESYSTLLYYLGFALFPLVLLIVYFNLSLQIVLVVGLILVLLFKILVFYKWIKLFCDNLHGILLLIVYFWAVEIIPCFLLQQGLVQLNDCLTIKI